MSRSDTRYRRIRSIIGTAILCAGWLCCGPAPSSPAADAPSWRRAYVPADAPDAWPAGEWEPAPLVELNAFLAAEAGGPHPAAAAPVLSRAVFRGMLTEDGACDGTLELEVQRPSGAGRYLEIGDVSVVLSQLAWEDEPAIWGTAPDDRVLLQVERPAGTITGRWSVRGRQVFSRRDFDLRLPAAGSTRIELLLPSSLRLRSNGGVVLPPVDAAPDQRLWVVELGRLSRCTCTLESAATPGLPLLHCDRALVYSIRPDVCRIQADFSVHAQRAVPAELVFDVPADVQRASATYAANTSLPSRLEVQGESAVLRVPLPRLAPGRIGTIRIVGEVPLREGADWELPVISLQTAALITGERRMHIDRPLTLSAVALSDVRQTGLDADVTGGDWFYEDLSATSTVAVRIGRPTVLTTARVLTRIDAREEATEFRAAIDLQCHSGSAFHAVFRIPAGWQVTDVVPAPQSAASGVSSWGVSDGEGERWLDVEFRQAITSQATRRIVVSGRWVAAGTDCIVERFPAPASAAESSVVLAVAVPQGYRLTAGAGAREGLQRLSAGPPIAWNDLLESLALSARPTEYTWLAAGEDSGSRLTISREPAAAPTDSGKDERGVSTTAPADGIGPELRLSLSLHSALSGLDAEWVWHVARYRLPPHAGGEQLEFRLASPARFDALTVDGAPHEVLLDGDRVQAAPLAATAAEVAVHYRTPLASDRSILERTVRAPLPDCNAPVSGFEWRIAAPQRLRLTEHGVPWAIATEQWEPSWGERVFGPLARTGTSSRFRPWEEQQWRTLFDRDGRASQFVDWRRMREIRIAATDAPTSASLTLVDARISRGLGWTTLIAALIAAVLIRRFHRSLIPLALAAAAMLIGALYADVPYVCMLSGAFTGFGLGCLLPRSVIERRDVLSSWVGDGESARRRAAAAAGVGVVVVLTTALKTAWGQPGESDATPTAVSVDAGDAVEMLVPYQGDVLGPVAYLRRDLLPQFEAWRRERIDGPEYLLRTARYSTPAAEPQTLQAEYEVVLLTEQRPVAVRLPLRDVLFRESDHCRVNGQSALLRPNRSATSWLVEIDDGPDPDGDAPQTATVVISLRMPAGQPAFEFGVPAVIDSSFQITGRPPDRYETSALGGVRSTDDGSLQGALGGVATLRVSPASAAAPAVTGTAPLRGEAVSFIEVHPLRARIRTQLSISAPHADSTQPAPRTLSLLLPGRAEVREVASEGLRGYSAYHDSDTTTLLELEFQEQTSLTGRVIHLDYTAPLAGAEGGVVIPAIPLLEVGRLRSHRVGLRPTRGLSLTSRPPASDAVQLLPVELFEAPQEGPWPAPDAAFVLSEPAPIALALARIEPARSVALEQTLTIGAQEIAWRLSAVMEVTAAPAYFHLLPIASGARIDQVSVTQDAADRLLSWSRDGDLLMVNVRSETVGRQELVITGQFPLDPEQPVPLPSSSMADATLTASELIIRNASPFVVRFLDDRGQVLPDEPIPAAAAAQTEGASARRMSLLLAGGTPHSLQLQAPAAEAPLNQHVALEHVAGQWRMTAVFRAAEGSQLPLPFEIQAAPDVAAGIGVHPGVAASWPTRPAGGNADVPVKIELRPADGHEWDECAVWVLLPPPESPAWVLPVIEPASAPIAARSLTLPAEAPLVPDPAIAARLEPDAAAAAGQPPLAESGAATTTYALSSSPVVLQQLTADAAPCRIEFAETVAWCDKDDQVAGLTIWRFVPQRSRCQVEAHLPAGLQLARVLSNGADIPPASLSDSRATIEFEDATPGTLHELRLFWRSPPASAAAGRRLFVQRPRPSELASGSELVSVLPPTHFDPVPYTQIGRQTAAQFDLLRLEALLQLATESGRGGGPGLALLYDEIETLLAAGSSRPAGVEESRRRSAAIRRWHDLQRRNAAPQAEGPPPPPFPEIAGSAFPPRADAVQMIIPTDVAGFDLWIIRQRTWMLTAVLLLMTGAAVMWRRWNRALQAGAASVPYAGLIVIGIVWWLWFIGSALGLLLCAVGLLLQAAQWLRPRPSVAPER